MQSLTLTNLRQSSENEKKMREQKFRAELLFNEVYPKLECINKNCKCDAKVGKCANFENNLMTQNKSGVDSLLDSMMKTSWTLREKDY